MFKIAGLFVRDEILIIRLSKNLKYLRNKNSLTQEQLAFESGIIRSQIARIEKGILNPSISTVSNLCKVLDCKMGDLLDEDL